MSGISASERIAVATAIGMNEQYLYQCLTGRRSAPVDRCPEIERVTGGKVICEKLRPDVAWIRLADLDWPWHPQGRPLIDVSRNGPESAPADGGSKDAG